MQGEKLIADIARIISGTRLNKQASYDAARAILPIIAREVGAEMERCAKVAQSKAEFGPAALAIAAAIRSAG